MIDGIKVDGASETAAALLELPRELALQVQTRVLRKAAQIIVDAVRAVHPPARQTGLWEESIGAKLWPDAETRLMFNVVLALIGSRRGSQYGERSNIAHLLEKGWRTVRKGTGTLEREDRRSAGTSRVTGKSGEGTAAGRVEGYKVFALAASITEGVVRQYLLGEIPKAATRAWKRSQKKPASA